jgi:hypothetical protein
VTATNALDRFTTLPDDEALVATVVALEEHGFSVEIAAASRSSSSVNRWASRVSGWAPEVHAIPKPQSPAPWACRSASALCAAAGRRA